MPGDLQLAARAVYPEVGLLKDLKLALVEWYFGGVGYFFVERLLGLSFCVVVVNLKFPE